jgi:hypothetical protein
VEGEGLFGWAYRPADGFHLANGFPFFSGLLGDKPSHEILFHSPLKICWGVWCDGEWVGSFFEAFQ